MDKFQCPCCDYFTLSERGIYDICPICYWEDDGLDLNKPDKISGPNHGLTIAQARENFSKVGACNKDMIKHVISPNKRDKYKYRKRTL